MPVRLLDHLIGDGEDARRDFKVEHSRGPEVEEKFKSCRLLHRQIASLLALEDLFAVTLFRNRD
jgi:hypothetical protein